MSQTAYERLKSFLEERPVAMRAAAPLKDGTMIRIRISGDATPYHVTRTGGKTLLESSEAPAKPQISFTISPKAIDRLVDFQSEDIGEYGVHFFKIMTDKDPDIELGVRLHTGFLGLMSLGVFNVLALGGGGVMSYLARHGLRSLGEIRKAISRLKTGDAE